MAQLVAFHYLPRRTPLHRIDPRFALPSFLLLVAAALHSSPIGLLLLTVCLFAAFAAARLPAGRIAKELRAFGVLLLAMFFARCLGAGHGSVSPFSSPALEAAGLLVWKLSLLVLLGILLAATTRVSLLQSAVAWYLRPIPFVPAGRIATMLGLTIALVPLVFDTYREVADAQAARCIGAVRNPIRRVRALAVPLMLKTFGRADGLAAAMESRCYSDDRSFAALSARRSDWLAALLVALLAAAALGAGRVV